MTNVTNDNKSAQNRYPGNKDSQKQASSSNKEAHHSRNSSTTSNLSTASSFTTVMSASSMSLSTGTEVKHMFSADKPGAESKDGEGIPRVHPMYLLHGHLCEYYDPDVKTLYDAFKKTVAEHGQRQFLAHRPIIDGHAMPYEWETYDQIAARVKNLSTALAQIDGLEQKSNIGIWSINRPEWIIAEYACYTRNMVTVPLFDTLAKEAVQYVLEQSQMTMLFASSLRAENMLKILKMDLKKDGGNQSPLKYIVVFPEPWEYGPPGNGKLPTNPDGNSVINKLSGLAKETGITLIELKELEQKGSHLLSLNAEKHNQDIPPAPADLCTICYTSGATGMPKGVMLPHSAMIAAVSGVLAVIGKNPLYALPSDLNQDRMFISLNQDDVHLSFLPLAHIFERLVAVGLAVLGAATGFYQGVQDKLLDDAQDLKPTIFLTVPRVCTRFHDKIQSALTTKPLRRWLFNRALESKRAALKQNGSFRHWLWDFLVFRSIRDLLGGRVVKMLSGSAPLSPSVAEFMRLVFSVELYEGYGQTETSAGSSVTEYGDWKKAGHVGAPVPCVEFKLVDLPDMGYTSKDKPYARGEICIRGPACFIGYYKDSEKTAETLDSEGWVHTGDVGQWDASGRLSIIDRKKNIFKLAQGEYIAPERIEGVFVRSPYINQSFVYGDSLENCLVAVIVPDPDTLIPWAIEHGIIDKKSTSDEETMVMLVKEDRVKALFVKQIEGFGKQGSRDLSGFEVPRAIYLEPAQFTIENGCLTSTMKSRRSELTKLYKSVLDKLYEKARLQVSSTVFVLSGKD